MRVVGGVVDVSAGATSPNVLKDSALGQLYSEGDVTILARVQTVFTSPFVASDQVTGTFASASDLLADAAVLPTNMQQPAANPTFGTARNGVKSEDVIYSGMVEAGQLSLTFRNTTSTDVSIAWRYEVE